MSKKRKRYKDVKRWEGYDFERSFTLLQKKPEGLLKHLMIRCESPSQMNLRQVSGDFLYKSFISSVYCDGNTGDAFFRACHEPTGSIAWYRRVATIVKPQPSDQEAA